MFEFGQHLTRAHSCERSPELPIYVLTNMGLSLVNDCQQFVGLIH